MAGSININQNNNDITIQDQNGKLTITDNNTGITTNVTQPVTSVVTAASLGPRGIQGIQGPPGPTYERLSDFQFPYQYSGNAVLGTLTSSTGWIINRINYTTPGSPITLQAIGSWDNRTSLIYS
jgi:hypothetical protein